MIRVSSILVALCLFFALAQAQDSCQVSASLTRRVGSDWSDAGKQYTIYDVSVVNTGTCDLEVIHLMFMLPTGGTISQAWNLEALGGGVWSLMNFGPTLTPGTTFTGAGIVLEFTDQATISVSIARNTCVSTCQLAPTTPPTSTPTPTSAPTTPPTSAPTTPPTSAPSTPPTGSPATPPPVTQELIEDLILAATEVDRQALLEDQQFVFDFKNSLVGITQSAGGKTVSANRKDFPAVVGHNIAMTVGFIEACGINLPHTHPRATEINFIASGRFQAGMFQENGARFIGNILEAGMATVFPQGAIHFEINLECEPAVFVAAFNNEDPGVQTTADSFFGLPKDVTAVSLNTSIATVEELARFLPMNPAVAMQECMQRCGFAK